jgi:hypothetical protein
MICRCFLEIIEISSSLVHKLTGIFGTGHHGKVEQTTLAIRPSLVLLHRNSPQKKKCPRNGYLAFCPTNHHSKWNGAVAAVPVPSYFVRFSQFCQSVPVLISGKFKAFLEENIFLLGIPTDL